MSKQKPMRAVITDGVLYSSCTPERYLKNFLQQTASLVKQLPQLFSEWLLGNSANWYQMDGGANEQESSPIQIRKTAFCLRTLRALTCGHHV